MTQPNPTFGSADKSKPFGGRLEAGASLTGPVKPQPAAPLTDEQLRTQCVTLAVQAKVDPRSITASAERIYQYIKTGTPGDGSSVGRNEGA